MQKSQNLDFFWLDRKQYGWFALFPLAKTPPSVSCCWFQSAFCLRNEQWIHTRVRYEISSVEIFSISSYTKNCSQKFTDHLNEIWYRLQVTEATNGFTFQIINSWMEFLCWFDCNSFHSSFRNLRIILSDLRFHNTFQFVKYGASA